MMKVEQPKEFYLSEEELNQFNENGYLGPYTLYEPEEMNALWKTIRRDVADRTHAVYPDEVAQAGVTNIANYDRHLDVDLLSKHICRPEITHRIASIFGRDLLCWRTEFFPKYPGDEGTDWHQADTFANASGTPQIIWPDSEKLYAGGTLTVWTAFTESTLKNGCLQLIPGTHRNMNYDETKRMEFNPDAINAVEKDEVKRGFFGYDYRDLQIDPNWKPDESQAYPLVMRPGQFVIFLSTLMHASLPHTGEATDYRMGFAARYVPTKVKVYPDTELVMEYGGQIPLDKYGAVLVSGQDEYGHNVIAKQTTRGVPFDIR